MEKIYIPCLGISEQITMIGYYDAVLGLIPVSLLGLGGLLSGVGLSFTVAVPIAAVVALGFVGHALFVNAPVGPGPDAETGAAPPDASSGPVPE